MGRVFVRCSLALIVAGAGVATPSAFAQATTVAGISCTTPPPAHCGPECARELLGNPGNVTEPMTGRTFFLDVPCDLKPEEQVIVILNLHGAGSIGNWQRHYFPALDFKEKYRLVIATPTAGGSGTIGASGAPAVRMWGPSTDDAYLQNVTNLVLDRVGRANVKAFWLAGHSQGGMTSNRVVCSDFFKDKVDGWLSLSGGRIGPAPISPDFFGPSGPPAAPPGGGNAPRPGVAAQPACDISFIFTSGQHENHGIAGDVAVGGQVRMWCAHAASRRRGLESRLRDRSRSRPRRELGSRGQTRHGGGVRVPELPGWPRGGRRVAVGQGPHRRARTERHRNARSADGVRSGREGASIPSLNGGDAAPAASDFENAGAVAE